MNPVVSDLSDIGEYLTPLALAQSVPPSDGRIVVVGARIADAIRHEVDRQIGILGGRVIERELEDLHPGKAEIIAELLHFWCHEPEVLGPDRQMPQFVLERVEESIARTFSPGAVDRGRLAVRHLPEGLKATEVVDAHDVDELRQPTESLDPPGEATLFQMRPVVDGVAPQLARGAEIVRRHTRHQAGLERVRKQREILRIRPDVDAVERDIERNVSDDPDAALMCVVFQGRPLPKERELRELVEVHGLAQRLARLFERGWLTPNELGWPQVPRLAWMRILERHEEGVVVQPVGPLRAEALVLVSQQRSLEEPPRGLLEYRKLPGTNGAQVNRARGRCPRRCCWRGEALFGQRLQTDQQRIARTRGERRIGRPIVSRRPERQDLPELLVRGAKEVDEGPGRGTEVTDAPWTRER